VLTAAVGLAALGLAPAALRRALAAAPAPLPAFTPAPLPVPASGTWLVLLGTHAGPVVDLTRSQTASAVIVDGTPYLVDCGYGTLRQLTAAGIGFQHIDQVFFTHLHDDHTADLAALLDFQWMDSKATPTDAYGPYGTARLVEAALAYSRANVEIRVVDEGRGTRPEALCHGHDVAAAATPIQVYHDARVRVTAIENTHYPARATARMPHRSIALRFDTRDRSIVFAGDTAYSANVVELARGADVFVCEIMDTGVHAQMLEQARAAAAAGNPESISRHIAETHSPPADVARMAREAGARRVVLNHLLTERTASGAYVYPLTRLIEGVRQDYRGEVIVGQDLMVL
jgi:ribonuclease BN (tRNA processing enzyme)